MNVCRPGFAVRSSYSRIRSGDRDGLKLLRLVVFHENERPDVSMHIDWPNVARHEERRIDETDVGGETKAATTTATSRRKRRITAVDD